MQFKANMSFKTIKAAVTVIREHSDTIQMLRVVDKK